MTFSLHDLTVKTCLYSKVGEPSLGCMDFEILLSDKFNIYYSDESNYFSNVITIAGPMCGLEPAAGI